MDLILTEHKNLLHRLRRLYSEVKIEELKQFFDHLIDTIKNLTYTNQKSDGLDLLTIICEDLAASNVLQLFDHLALINHPIFIYIGRTLEMLLTKFTHSQSIPMQKYEENCFYSLSYLVVQLCYYRNEPIECFYGSISKEIPSVTWKINIRDETIDETSRKSNPIARKPNIKIAALPPSAPKSRPIEQRELDIDKTMHLKKLPEQPILPPQQTTTTIILPALPTDLPLKKYQDVFLTKSFFEKFNRAIIDLSQHDYSSYHIKYKVIDRLVRLCSKLNLVEPILDSILKCLRSKFYRQAFSSIESEQWYLNPKQLFLIYRCPRLLIQHEFQQPEQILNSLCQTMIAVTKSILDLAIPIEGDNNHLTDPGRQVAHHTLHYHLELLNNLTLTSIGRRYFIQSSIINQMIEILNSDQFEPNHVDELFDADPEIIANALMLLYNLAYEQEIFAILKRKDLQDLLSKYQSSTNYSIQFAVKTLAMILGEDQIDEENEPIKLKKDYLEYLGKVIIQSKEIRISGARKEIEDRDYFSKKKKNAVVNELLLDTTIRDVEQLATAEHPSNKSIYKDVSRRVRVCTKQDTIEVEKLLDPILKCLGSKFYLDVFENIEFNQTKATFGSVSDNRCLADKHIFFMRECPEFLFRHDYKQYNDIANSLGKKMLGYTRTIFDRHLPVIFSNSDGENPSTGTRDRRASRKGPDADETVRMEALSYHIKMLTHFTQTRSMRREFLRTSIIDEILRILQVKLVSDNGQAISDVKLAVIGQSLVLLYNLALENEISVKLKKPDILDLCFKFGVSNDKIIHFSSQILSIMLNKHILDDLHKPDLLSKTSVEYIGRSVNEPTQLYQGIKLDGLLKSLKSIFENDTFTESFVREKGGIRAITECVCAEQADSRSAKMRERVQNAALDIVWKLSYYGPDISKKLKEKDEFVDRLLVISTKSSDKLKDAAARLIWRLGSEETIRSELTKKQADRRGKDGDSTEDDQLPRTDQWDASIPYDLLISVSSNVTDRVLSAKIYNRLIMKGYRVYSANQSKHRLELMRQAIEKGKPILVCLSKDYRSSKLCMAEAEYAQKKSCPIIPILVEANFKIQGWLKFILGEAIPTDFTDKDFDKKLIGLCDEIEKFKSSD